MRITTRTVMPIEGNPAPDKPCDKMKNSEYCTFKFMLEGKTAKWISVVAISLEAARADIEQAYFNPIVITVRICSK